MARLSKKQLSSLSKSASKAKKAVTRFNRKIAAMRRMISYWIGDDNYAGSSSQTQLDRIQEKFLDCVFPWPNGD